MLEADAVFTALQLADGLSLESLIREVERERSTSIRIVPLDDLSGTSACGLLLASAEAHTIFHLPTSSDLHRTQCILHELSHMLLRDDESSLGDEKLARFAPDIRLDVGDKLFGRGAFDDESEMAAEHLADLLASAVRARAQPVRFEEYFG
jgi:hypothetical protein